MTRVSAVIRILLVGTLSTLHAAFGCGQLPQAEGRTVRFNVTGFTLPAAMAYTNENNVAAQVPSISRSEQTAITLVQNLVMRSVENVLEQQGRSAGLADIVISAVLQQLTIKINYEPLKCDKVFTIATAPQGGQMHMYDANKLENCFIIENTVRTLCMANGCVIEPQPSMIKPVPMRHFTISGSLETRNVIMANWSNQMWQSVLYKVARGLTVVPFGSHFSGVVVAIV